LAVRLIDYVRAADDPTRRASIQSEVDGMRAILFGASGMVGMGVLLECLEDPRVESVLAVGRRPCGVRHPKVREWLREDFLDWSDAGDRLEGLDACFFCLGVSAAGLDEAAYTRLTLDLTLAVAEALVAVNPGMTFCYVSGQGTDSSGRSRMMWARVKGLTENRLLSMPFRAANMFRPGFIQPLKGVRSRTPLYQALITVARPLFPLLRRLFPNQVCTSVSLGRAMIRVAAQGWPAKVLEARDIQAASAP
jgi:uncharacterized protein YbjT (DUF2867 family)